MTSDKVLAQGAVECLIGDNLQEVNVGSVACCLELLDKVPHGVSVCIAKLEWLRDHFLTGFHITEGRSQPEAEIQLAAIENLNGDDFVPLVSQVLECCCHAFQVIEEIAEHDHQAPTMDPLGEHFERTGSIGYLAGLNAVERCQQLSKIGALRSWRVVRAERVVIERKPDSIFLQHRKVRKRGCQIRRVRELGNRAFGSVPHRSAPIDRNDGAEICFLLELFDVVASCPTEHLPIEVPKVIARMVCAVLGELRTKAVEWRAVQPRQETFNDEPRS